MRGQWQAVENNYTYAHAIIIIYIHKVIVIRDGGSVSSGEHTFLQNDVAIESPFSEDTISEQY